MATGLIDIMKRAALEANENAKPCDLRFGTVTSTNPIKINVTPQFILPESALIIPKRLTDYEINITITGFGWETENKSGGSGDSAFASHNHSINQSNKTIKVHNALKNGDKVALLRQSGGQSYFVLDRI